MPPVRRDARSRHALGARPDAAASCLWFSISKLMVPPSIVPAAAYAPPRGRPLTFPLAFRCTGPRHGLCSTARRLCRRGLRGERHVSTAQETGGGRIEAEPARWRPVLLERDGELAAVDTLIGSTGRLLALEGPPGIGKTSLITETRRRAEASGMQVFG